MFSLNSLRLSLLLGLFTWISASSQTNVQEVDSLFREDQFFVGFQYNLLNNPPQGIAQYGLSGGIQLGIIRDMPISKNRRWSFGIGLGYALDYLNHNIQISKNANGQPEYNILSLNAFDSNKLVTHAISLPVELRWRTATPAEYNFFRIYPGFRLSKIFSNRASFSLNSEKLKYTSNIGIQSLEYGPTLSVGYAQFNLNLYYGLNEMFTPEAIDRGAPSGISKIKLGIILYIL
jgi:hypothetical protein